MYASYAKLNISSILRRTFSTLFEHPVIFLSLAVISVLPTLGLQIYVRGLAPGNISLGTICLLILFSLLLGTICMAAMSYSAYQAADEMPFSLWESLSASLGKIFSLIGLAILAAIAITVGFMVLIVPGIIICCMVAVSVPVCVLEDLGPLSSLNRSAELTKGNRWNILGLLAISTVGAFVLNFLALLVGGIIMYAAGNGSENIIIIITEVTNVLRNAYFYTMLGVIYYDLYAIETGGTGLGIAAAVFD